MRKIMVIAAISATLLGFESTIPVLDMEDFHNPKRHELFVEQLSQAFQEVGFFALINADIEKETLDDAYNATFTLFNLPMKEKNSLYNPLLCGRRGYVPSEVAKGRKTKDHKEFYHVGAENFELENIWPENHGIRERVESLYEHLANQAQTLGQAISEALGSTSNLIPEMITNSNSVLRALHYFKGTPEGGIWAGEHTDINLFTILPRSTGAGLQVLGKDGNWIDVKVPDGAFVVNCGDMLQNMSNGLFRSSVHRVIEKGENKDRYSIVFFIHPRYECSVSPLPSAIKKTGGKQLFPTATERELFSERMADNRLANEEMLRFVKKSGIVERMKALGKESPTVLEQIKIVEGENAD